MGRNSNYVQYVARSCQRNLYVPTWKQYIYYGAATIMHFTFKPVILLLPVVGFYIYFPLKNEKKYAIFKISAYLTAFKSKSKIFVQVSMRKLSQTSPSIFSWYRYCFLSRKCDENSEFYTRVFHWNSTGNKGKQLKESRFLSSMPKNSVQGLKKGNLGK